MESVYFNWSTGKDASLALYYLLQDDNYKVEKLLTSVNQHYDRVSMHGLRRELLEQQVAAIGLPLVTVELPQQPTMEEYEVLMSQQVNQLKSEGIHISAFGDIFLEDLRAYREQQLAHMEIKCVFPLWKRDTRMLIGEMLSLGFKMVVVAAASKYFDEDFVGKVLTEEIVDALPQGVDPCGENGEFHTFCFDGPIFKQPIAYHIAEKVYRAYKDPEDNTKEIGFWYCDLETTDK